MKALLVDDSEIQRYFVRTVLEADGWEVRQADCVAAALPLVDGVSLCCLDVRLPDGTAADVRRHLRDCAVLLLSGDGDGLAELADALDADGWHVKDADAAALRDKIAGALSRRAARAAAAASPSRR